MEYTILIKHRVVHIGIYTLVNSKDVKIYSILWIDTRY